MAETKSAAGAEDASSTANPDVKQNSKTGKPLRPPNPMYKYMGLGENFRPKLPSRNWLIFLSITGSFTAAVIYDKREKKRVQQKWCKLVEHIAKEPLDPRAMPRRLRIFLEGPPTDGLRVAQDHFKEYVKPILVASGLDWEFIQGRKEGDIRAELANKIRDSRLPPDQKAEEDVIDAVRREKGVQEYDGPRGDIVIGRHTWKEYVRGLHEGWLGPVTAPPKPNEEKPAAEIQPLDSPEQTLTDTPSGDTTDPSAKDASEPTPTLEKPTDKDKPTKPPQPPPFISTSDYPSATPPPSIPTTFDPSQPISFPHILGFLNTPKRLYRFLNRRVLADQIGRETAAIILANARPYQTSVSTDQLPPSDFVLDDSPQAREGQLHPQVAEQQTVLWGEEAEWHKSAIKRVEGEGERTWLEPVVLDPRIAARMRRFELSAEDEERAKRIVVPEEEVEGWIKGSIRGLGRRIVRYARGENKKKTPVYVEDEEESLN